MKKLLSVALCLCLLLSVMSVAALQPYETTFEDLDVDKDMVINITYEPGTLYSHLSSGLYTWQIDDGHSLTYYPGSWSVGSVDNNPVRGATGVPGSVVNDSEKALYFAVSETQGWKTQGGNVVNIKDQDGVVRPLILENGVTYKVSFDYLVYRCHRTDTFTNSSGNQTKVSTGEMDEALIGYGYDLTTNSNYHPVTYPTNTIGTFISYSEKNNGASGATYTGFSGEEQTGNWYHAEYTFTPSGLDEYDFNTTPDITADKNAPFLIIFRRTIAGGASYIDNIQVTRPVQTTLNPMGGSVTGTETLTGFVGESAPAADAVRYGYDFKGWYKDGACTVPYDGVIRADMNRKELYASWSDVVGFESYRSQAGPSSVCTDRFSVTEDAAYSGKRALRYKYLSGSSYRDGISSLFTVKPVADQTSYKVTFKYYAESGSVKMYPVTIGDSYNSKYVTYTGTAITTTANEVGKWMTGTFYLTTGQLNGGNNLCIYVAGTSNSSTASVLIDDVVVDLSSGCVPLTVNAGAGTIRGAQSATVSAELGSHLLFDNLSNGTKAVKGYYYDNALTEKCTESIVTEALSGRTLYVAWGDEQGYEYALPGAATPAGYVPVTVQKERASFGRYAVAFTRDNGSDEQGFINLGSAEASGVYVIRFKYYIPTAGQVTFNTALFNAATGGSVTTGNAGTVSGNTGSWQEYALLVTAGSTLNARTELGLTVSPAGTSAAGVYVDDVCVTKLASNQRCVIFDTVDVGGTRTVAIGQNGTAIAYPDTRGIIGYTVTGWYTSKTFSNAYTAANFATNTVVYAKTTARAATTVSGDADGNGVRDTGDLVALKKYLSGYDVALSDKADINGDGRVDVRDLLRLSKQLAGVI